MTRETFDVKLRTWLRDPACNVVTWKYSCGHWLLQVSDIESMTVLYGNAFEHWSRQLRKYGFRKQTKVLCWRTTSLQPQPGEKGYNSIPAAAAASEPVHSQTPAAEVEPQQQPQQEMYQQLLQQVNADEMLSLFGVDNCVQVPMSEAAAMAQVRALQKHAEELRKRDTAAAAAAATVNGDAIVVDLMSEAQAAVQHWMSSSSSETSTSSSENK